MQASARERASTWVLRAAMLTLAWWTLVEGRMDTWLFAAPVIALAAATSVAMRPARRRIRIGAAASFFVHFLHRAVIGGIDVARRALHPRMPISPGFILVPVRLQDPGARLLLLNVASLMPGTLSAALEGDDIRLHVIDTAMPACEQLTETETYIARMLDAPPPESRP